MLKAPLPTSIAGLPHVGNQISLPGRDTKSKVHLLMYGFGIYYKWLVKFPVKFQALPKIDMASTQRVGLDIDSCLHLW